MSKEEWEEFQSELNYLASQLDPTMRDPLDLVYEMLNDLRKKIKHQQELIEELFNR